MRRTGMQLARALVVAVVAGVAVGAAAGRAEADQPPRSCFCKTCPDDPCNPRDHRPRIEWSTWLRLAAVARTVEDSAAARMTEPAPRLIRPAWEAGLGLEASLPLTDAGDLRIGAWGELRGFFDAVAGLEVVLTAVPKEIDMFFYTGQGILAVRGGGNREVATVQVAYGYLAPWQLFRRPRGDSRYMIGVRLVGTFTRAHDDPHDWSAGVGLEFEPVGALRYLLGLRCLY